MRAALASIILLASATVALAACPAGTSYQCYQGYGGKVVCSCR